MSERITSTVLLLGLFVLFSLWLPNFAISTANDVFPWVGQIVAWADATWHSMAWEARLFFIILLANFAIQGKWF